MNKPDEEIKSENSIDVEEKNKNGESTAPDTEQKKENNSPAASRGKGGFKLGERGKLAIILTSVLLVIALIVSIVVISFTDRQYDEDGSRYDRSEGGYAGSVQAEGRCASVY